MSDSPDEIRAEIDRTRGELGLNVDALADKVSPSKAVHRQTDKVKGAFGSVRERLMGAADDAGASVSGAGSAVGDAGHSVKAKADGNPLAVGLIAFGVGLAVAALIPASAKEKQAADAVKDQAQPLIDQTTDAAKQVGEHLKEPTQQAAAAVKETAADAVANVKDDASDAATTVTDRAQEARTNVSDN